MARESSHYGRGAQFLLGVNPLNMQGLEVEGSSDLLSIEMLEASSRHQHAVADDHFEGSFAGHQGLLGSSNTAEMSLLAGSKQMNLKHHSLSLLNTKPPYHHHHHQQQVLFDLKSSVYLKAARELLTEFCSVEGGSSSKEGLPRTSHHWELQPSLYSTMNHLELHNLKIKLLSMLEEVRKRYRRYREQMQAIVSMMEAVAGEGAADGYSALASKAMSRHFRRLKDGIVAQLRAVKKAMGEMKVDGDRAAAAGMTARGETPRLKLLDQCVQQRKSMLQGMAHQQLPWRPQRGLPEHSVSVLRAWLFEHFLHPYPSDVDKIILARQTGLSRSQVSNWFINARVRIWKPMVEEMYLEEMKELEINNNVHPKLPPPSSTRGTDQKSPPLPAQLLSIDSGSLSSIVNGGHDHADDESFGRLHRVDDFDFYSNFAGGSLRRSGVSLTLGLQQHGGGGMSLSFSPASQHSVVFSREHIGRGQQVDFSALDRGDAQTFPCDNLMGAH